jgi:hypothetical protein
MGMGTEIRFVYTILFTCVCVSVPPVFTCICRRPTQAAILEDSRMDKMVDEGGSCGDLLFLWMV